MPSHNIRLIYPQSQLDEPIVNHLLRRYDFTINILRASISEDQGWMDIQVSGKAAEIEDAISWLKDRGLEVLRLSI